jgi:hypothetical protein
MCSYDVSAAKFMQADRTAANDAGLQIPVARNLQTFIRDEIFVNHG